MSALIHILRNREKEGSYTTQQNQHMLTDGSIGQYILARKEGLSEWASILQILESLPAESSYTSPLPASIATGTTTRRDGIGRLAYLLWQDTNSQKIRCARERYSIDRCCIYCTDSA